MKVYLVGYMYSGKTTFGRQLAERLGLTFVDTDQLFEQRFRVSIARFFEQYDEPLFRRLEAQVLRSTEALEDVVVATGGGTPCYEENMQWMLGAGVVVHLTVTPEQICERLAVSRHPRPLLMRLAESERLPYVAEQLARRTPYYQQAHLQADGYQPDLAALQAAILAWRPDEKS